MDLKSFQRSFKIYEINLKPYIMVVSIFISILLIIIIFSNNIKDYYLTKGMIKNGKVEVVVNIDNLDKITKNEKIIIKENIFTYEVIQIDDLITGDILYKKIILNVDGIGKENIVENDVTDVKIIINTTTIFEYLLKILKGE